MNERKSLIQQNIITSLDMRFSHVCLLCVVVLAKEEEHFHELEESQAQGREDATMHNISHQHQDHHDDHADHDHSSHSRGHNHHSVPGHQEGQGGHDHNHNHDQGDPEGHTLDLTTWLAACSAILVISLCGIFGVLVIPLMRLVFYQHMIQFLIALAVGTLVGDALLHLLPHALLAAVNAGHHPSPSQHESAVWLGLVAVLSMLGFFFFEKCVNMFGEWREARSRRKARSKPSPSPRLNIVREGHEASDLAQGETHCKKKYSNYCVQDFDKSTVEEATKLNGVNGIKPLSVSDANSNRLESEEPGGTVIISSHEVVHHGHSHAHSHLHSAPSNMSSVALMVITGDGIHNLADGLAIGAAFADGYMSGISTSIAVLCHELPHEIGDFAMLLKAGMTIKQAVFYNILSSVLALIGMVLGLLLGTVEDFSPWIFTATAGIFLYVALVDMMPELSSGHAHPIADSQPHSNWLELILHMFGMLLGVGIMLLIAIYEHDIKDALSEHQHAH